MRKNLLLAAAGIILSVFVFLFLPDGWIYLSAILMGATVLVVIRLLNSKLMRMTRWAKANPKKTRVLITMLQLVILFVALMVGYDLKQLDYKLTDNIPIIFAGVLLAGFLSIRFLPKTELIALPFRVNRDRFIFTSIILSAFMLMVFIGNRIEDKFPNSPVTATIKSVDHAIFGDDAAISEDQELLEAETNIDHSKTNLIQQKPAMLSFASVAVNENSFSNPMKSIKEKIKPGKKFERIEKLKKKLLKKYRKLFGAGATVGTILLIILLVITTCAGICLIIAGVSGSSVALVPLGLVVLAGSIFGFIKIGKGKKEPRIEK